MVFPGGTPEKQPFQLFLFLGKVQLAALFPHHDFRPFREVALQELEAEGVQQVMLNGPLEGTRSIDRVKAMVRHQGRSLRSHAQEQALGFQALADALEAVNGGYTLDAAGVCVDDALRALYELTGENAGDDVIDEVFSRFCVGK